MNADDRILVCGSGGLVGSAIVRALTAAGHTNLLTPRSHELDLTDPAATIAWFADKQPQYVFLAAARVGGILANDTYPVEFLRDNLLIEINVMEAAHRSDVSKLLFLGSSCIYPRMAAQPISEDALLTGPLEPTNEPYALAKIAGIKLCQAYRREHDRDFISVMPTNLYGPGDNYDLGASHVLPALIRKAHDARERGDKTMTIWGSGTPRREFLYVDDLAQALLFLMRTYSDAQPINIGTGNDVTIADAARLVCDVVGFDGDLVYDTDKPDGTPRKQLDVSRLHELGWSHATTLRSGLELSYAWFRDVWMPRHDTQQRSVTGGQ